MFQLFGARIKAFINQTLLSIRYCAAKTLYLESEFWVNRLKIRLTNHSRQENPKKGTVVKQTELSEKVPKSLFHGNSADSNINSINHCRLRHLDRNVHRFRSNSLRRSSRNPSNIFWNQLRPVDTNSSPKRFMVHKTWNKRRRLFWASHCILATLPKGWPFLMDSC